MKKYTFLELRQMAKAAGHRGWGVMNKDELCALVGVVRIEHEPKYVLKSKRTGELTRWRSVRQMSRSLDVNSGNVFYAIKKGRPLKVKSTDDE